MKSHSNPLLIAPLCQKLRQLGSPCMSSGVGRQTQGAYNSAGIYGYNFAFKPAEHQPSGTCNFSRIALRKRLVFASSVLLVFAYLFNLLQSRTW